MKKVFSTKKGKAIFSVVIAAAVAGISIGSYQGYKYNKQQQRLEAEAEAKEAQDELDANTARNTEELIKAIGDVTLDSEPAITKAEDSYAKLTDNAKSLVSNYDTLTEDRALYDKLVAEDNVVKEEAKTIAEDTASGTAQATDTASTNKTSDKATNKKSKPSTGTSSKSSSDSTKPSNTTANTATTTPAQTAAASTGIFLHLKHRQVQHRRIPILHLLR